MTNKIKLMLCAGVLAGLSACGGDDSDKPVDAGNVVKPVVDGSVPDSGTTPPPGNMDGGINMTTNDGGDNQPPASGCFTGTPVQMADFLNRCTTAQTTDKTLAVPAALLSADGNVLPL